MRRRRGKSGRTKPGRRKALGTHALAKSVRKRLPPPGKPFKTPRPARSAWRKDLGDR